MTTYTNFQYYYEPAEDNPYVVVGRLVYENGKIDREFWYPVATFADKELMDEWLQATNRTARRQRQGRYNG